MSYETTTPPTFRVMCFNILAQAYARPRNYPYTTRDQLAIESRLPLILEEIKEADADLISLQEVEAERFEDIRALLSESHEGIYLKRNGKPDGCAIFYRTSRFTLEAQHELHFSQHESSGDRIALFASLMFDGTLPIGLVATHLQWQREETPSHKHLGLRGIREVLETCSSETFAQIPWLISGDFNANSQSVVVEEALDAGYRLSCRKQRPWDTVNINGRRRKIDYVLYPQETFMTEPHRLPRLGRETPMPSDIFGSDHLPVVVDFTPA